MSRCTGNCGFLHLRALQAQNQQCRIRIILSNTRNSRTHVLNMPSCVFHLARQHLVVSLSQTCSSYDTRCSCEPTTASARPRGKLNRVIECHVAAGSTPPSAIPPTQAGGNTSRQVHADLTLTHSLTHLLTHCVHVSLLRLFSHSGNTRGFTRLNATTRVVRFLAKTPCSRCLSIGYPRLLFSPEPIGSGPFAFLPPGYPGRGFTAYSHSANPLFMSALLHGIIVTIIVA